MIPKFHYILITDVPLFGALADVSRPDVDVARAGVRMPRADVNVSRDDVRVREYK